MTGVPASRLDPVRSQIREIFGYEARFSHFPIIGLCAHCAGKDAAHDEHHHEHTH